MRTTAYVILGLLFLLAVGLWAVFAFEIFSISARLGTTVAAGLGLDDPGFATGFTAGLHDLWNPVTLFEMLEWETVVLLGAAATTVWIWRDLFGLGTEPARGRMSALFAALPLVVGTIFSWFSLRASFDALAEAGISSPDLLGTGFAASLAATLVGFLLAIALAVAYPILRRAPYRT